MAGEYKAPVKHTSGPWHTDGIVKMDSARLISSAEQKWIACAYDFNRFDRDDEVDANAKLIAASPDLLAIAQRCEDYFNSEINGTPMQITENLIHSSFLQDDLLTQLRAAISKATQITAKITTDAKKTLELQ